MTSGLCFLVISRARNDLQMPDIAVIIPTHNRASVLGRALQSVLQSDMPGLEVIVVDDASTDETEAVTGEFQDPRLQYERLPVKSNGNVARNRGIELSTAPIIAFLDSDDVFLAGRIERLARYFADHPDIDGVVDGFRVVSGRRENTIILPQAVLRDNALPDLLIKHAVPLTCSAIVARRTPLEQINGFDGSLLRQQDRDLLLRFGPRNTVVLGTGQDVIKYQSGDSLSRKPIGYIVSLDDLVGRHPRFLEPQFEDVLLYLTSRVVLKSFLGGRISAGLEELRSLKRAKHLPRSLLKGILRYTHGKRLRAAAMAP